MGIKYFLKRLYIYIYIYIYMCVCVCIYIYINIYIYYYLPQFVEKLRVMYFDASCGFLFIVCVFKVVVNIL